MWRKAISNVYQDKKIVVQNSKKQKKQIPVNIDAQAEIKSQELKWLDQGRETGTQGRIKSK